MRHRNTTPATPEQIRIALITIIKCAEAMGGYNKPVSALTMDAIRRAHRILAVSYRGHGLIKLPRNARKRVQEFGINGQTGEIINKLRWAHAESIYEQSGRLPWKTFEARLNSGCDPLSPLFPGDLPPVNEYRKKQTRPRRESVKKYVVKQFNDED
jgi:hypothetical protein